MTNSIPSADLHQQSAEQYHLQHGHGTVREERRVVIRIPSREDSLFRLRCAESIPSGCRLRVWFDIGFRAGKWLLSGEVRWSRQMDAPHGDNQMGIFLHAGAAVAAVTDIEAWQRAIWL